MAFFRCIRCRKKIPPKYDFTCSCGGLFEVEHSFPNVDQNLFNNRLAKNEFPYNSGVWRYKELIYPELLKTKVITRPEGNTNIYNRKLLSSYTGLSRLYLKHEGENPTGSFKDRGMTVGVTVAKEFGAETVVCASTGNTSASLAAYSAHAGIKCIVIIPEGMISYGKLAQALAYGAKVIQITGNFDDAMTIVREHSKTLGLYALNSLNPWRIEGQKSIMFELVQQLRWKPPDWIVVPAGNLGNTSAFGKAFREMKQLGLIKKIPRIAAIQAEGASPFYNMWRYNLDVLESVLPKTIASAIKIGNPVSWEKAIKVIYETKGLIEKVSDSDIMDAKAMIDRSGIGCEPASAATIAGTKKLIENGQIKSDEMVMCILTGNLLKDTENTVRYHLDELEGFEQKFSNKPISIKPVLMSIKEAIISEKTETERRLD
jgi:threonine synthase